MTRATLRPWLDQTVITRGRVTRWIKDGDDTSRVMLSPVEVWLQDQDVALLQQAPLRLDHLWFIGASNENIRKAETTMLSRVVLMGRVHQYARGNGSVDYGVRQEMTVFCETALDIDDPADFVSYAREARAAYDRGYLVLLDDKTSASRAMKQIERKAERIRRNAETHLATIIGNALQRGATPTDRGLVLPDGRRTRAQGFA